MENRVDGINLTCVVLPLYSDVDGIHVPERSGLNYWNTDGRLRDNDEASGRFA